jgi:hypothetical protein
MSDSPGDILSIDLAAARGKYLSSRQKGTPDEKHG